MEIVCIEGPHGCGKTSICDELKRRGYNTIDEGFLNMPKYALETQSFTMETIWLTRWVEDILNMHQRYKNGVMYADRSPFSAVLYAPEGHHLKIILSKILKELSAIGITIKTILIDTKPGILWGRIQERLKKEPHRIKYNENSREWMYKVISMYKNENIWNKIVSGDDDTNIIVDKIIDM